MRAVIVLARSVLRTSVVRTALVVFVLATSLGFAMFSATAARRTATAFDRFAVWAEAADAVAIAGPPDDEPDSERFDELAALPVVAESREAMGIGIVGAEVHGKVVPGSTFAAAAVDASLEDGFDRVLVLEGSIPEEPTANQGIIDFSTARELDLDVGDEVTLLASVEEGAPATPIPIDVVAIISSPTSFPTVAGYQQNGIAMGPEFLAAHGEFVDPYQSSLSIRLRGGLASSDDLRMQMDDAGLGHIGIFERDAIEVGAERLFTLEATTMWAAALLAVLVGLPVAYQLVQRDAAATRDPIATVLAIGASRRQLAGAAATRGVGLAVTAAVIGGIGAVLASPLSPVGLARDAEVERGVYVDAVVLAAGVPLFIVAFALLATAAVLRGGLTATGERRAPRAARWRQPRVPVAVGIQMATGSRGAVAVAGIGALAFVALLVVGISVAASSLEALPDDPDASGGAWDGYLLVDPSDPAVEEALASEPLVTAYGLGGWGVLDAQGEPVSTVFLPDSMEPAIASGSAPRGDREIALGAAAMRRLGVHVGDEVHVSFPGTELLPRGLTVTGETIAASPPIDSFAPDDAAIVRFDMPDGLSQFGPGELVRFARDGGDPEETLERVVAAMPEDTVFFAFARARRGDVVALEELEGLMDAILAMAATLALASLLHQVLVTHRRNASAVGVLRAIGFTRSNVGEAGAAHGGALAAVTAIVAIPVGLAAGATAWRFLSGELVVLPRTRYDLTTIIVVGVAVVVLAAMLAAVLARRSARGPVAQALRAE